MLERFLGLLLLFATLSSCSYESAQEESEGLIANHKQVENIFILQPLYSKTYLVNDKITLTFEHPFPITVTGTPRVEINLDSSTVYANYISGSSTKKLKFQYTVTAGDIDTHGFELGSDIDLNGGSLTFTGPKGVTDASNNFKKLEFGALKVDTSQPSIVSIIPPVDNTYLAGKNLFFHIKFDEKVYVSGTPVLQLNIDGNTVNASYIGGSGTDDLTFGYTVKVSDVDLDGILPLSPLVLQSGSIKDISGLDIDPVFSPVPATEPNSLLVDGDKPFVQALIPPVNDTYLLGETISLTLQFNEKVAVTGTPRITLVVGEDFKYAQYASGSGTKNLTFSYTVLPGESDLNGITITSLLDLNGGLIADMDGGDTPANLLLYPPLTPNVIVDAAFPEVTFISPPASDTYTEGEEISFTLNFDTDVNVIGVPQLEIILDSYSPTTVKANYSHGSGSDKLVFKYTVASGDSDLTGIELKSPLKLSGGSIKNISLLDADTDISDSIGDLDLSNILIDASSTIITAVTPPSNSTYLTSENLDFTFTFNEAVTVNGGTPRIQLNIGGSAVYADYISGSGTSNLLFRYTVQGGDLDTDGINFQSNSIDLNTAFSIQNGASENAILDFSGLIPNMSSVLVGEPAPYISSISPPSSQTYLETENIDFIVSTSENITVTGTPQIQLDIGGTTVHANYLSGSGTSALTFRYTVANNLEDLNGISLSSPVQLNSGTMVDADTNNLNLTFTAPNTSGVLVDSRAPYVTSVTAPSDDSYVDTEVLSFVVNYSEVVTVTNTPRLAIDIGGSTVYANYQSGSGSTSLTFSYNISGGGFDDDGITFASTNIDLNTTGTIVDQASVASNLDLTQTSSLPNMTWVLVNFVPSPTVTITTPNNILDSNKSSYQISGTCSANGQIVSISIEGGSVTDTPTCSGNAFTTASLDVSGLADSAVNTVADIDITADHSDGGGYSAIQATAAAIKDTSIPSISSNSISAQTYNLNDAIDLVVNFSENVTVTGSPRVQLNFETESTSPIYATYQSGSGTSQLIFRYTVASGDEDANNIASNAAIDPNSGSITDAPGNVVDYNLASTSYVGALVSALGPVVSSVILPSNSTYIEDDNLDFSVQWNNTINVTGTPRLVLTVGSNTRYATYLSGTGTNTINFRYTVTAGDLDLDGIALATSVDLNGGTLQDGSAYAADLALGSNDASGVLVYAILPTATIDSPSTINNSNYTSYAISGTCSDSGQAVVVNIGSLTVSPNPTCSSGVWNATVDVSSVADSASVALTADHQDALGNNANQATDSVIKDTDAPDVISNTISANTYNLGNTINLVVNFDQTVTVTGTPRFELNFESQSSTNIFATYSGGNGSSSLTFTYTVAAGDGDANGITLAASIDLNGGTIRDSNTNNAILPLATTSFGSVFVDSAAPLITSFIEPTNGTYAQGGELLFQINYSESVNISGSPRIILDIGGNTRYATYASGSGTTGLEFKYTVQASEVDNDGIQVTATDLDLNGGSITATSDADNAGLGFGTYLDSLAGVIVDTNTGITAPNQVTGVTTAPTTSNTMLSVAWTIPNNNGTAIINYVVQYREQGQSTWSSGGTPSTNSTTISGLSAGITYEIRVAANNGLQGPYSTISTAEIFDILSLNPIAWLDGSDPNGDGNLPNDNEKIATWIDKSGVAISHPTEANTTKQPTFKTNVLNGLPAVRFAGQAIGLEGSFSRTGVNGLSVFVVGRYDTGYSNRAMFEFHKAGNNRAFFLDNRYASNNNYTSNTAPGSFRIWTMQDNGNTTNGWIDGVQVYNNNANYQNTDYSGTGNYVLGDDSTGGNELYGHICEFLVFEGQVSAQDRQTIEDYLKNKWGL